MKRSIKQQKLLHKMQEITLIALVITIIVLLILAGITISALSGDNGILTNASKAKYATELSQYNEELQLFKSNKVLENMNFEGGSLISAENSLEYNTKPAEETGNIYNIIPSLEGSHFDGKLEVIKGELLLNSQDKTEIEVAQSVGVAVNPYEIVDGELISSNGNLLLMDEETGTLRLPESVTSIGEGAFANLEGLKTIIIPSTVKRIETNAFRNNNTLETVIMEEKENSNGIIEGVEYIGDQAFKNCSNLKTVKMANSVKETGVQVFYEDKNLQNINISTNLTVINKYMFASCISLTNIDIPEGVKTIDMYAFSNCPNIEKIEISSTLETIDGTSFYYCLKLKNIEIAKDNNNFEFKDGFLLGKTKENKTEIIVILESAIKDNTLTIPNTVTSLKSGQLSSFSQITTVNIPSSVESISGDFFENNKITNINIDSNNPNFEVDQESKAIYSKESQGDIAIIRYFGNENSVKIKDETKIIKSFCFYNKLLTQIELPDSITRIENQAFNGCKNLKNIKLGKNINDFNNLSIYNSGIEKIELDENNPNFRLIENGGICNGEEVQALYSKDGNKFISPIKPLNTIITYEIPEQVEINGKNVEVTEITNYAFHSQRNMSNIKLPNTIKRINISFNYCDGLNNIEIPSSIEYINESCFANSINLREIKIHTKKDQVKGAPWSCIYGDRAIIWDE